MIKERKGNPWFQLRLRLLILPFNPSLYSHSLFLYFKGTNVFSYAYAFLSMGLKGNGSSL